MARTVTVELKMKLSDFVANGEKAIAEMKALGAEVKVLGEKVKTTGKSTSEFSRLVTANLKDGETAFQSLTRRSGELRSEVGRLRTEFAKTGDVGIFGNLKSTQRDLQATDRFLKNMGQDAEQTFKSAENGSDDLRGMLLKLGVAASPFLVPVAAGSLLGLLGAGGIALGIAGQLQNADVQGAVAALGQDVSTTLTKATAPFKPALIDALNAADAGLMGFINHLRPAFAELAPELEPFTKTVSGGLLEAAPLFANAMAKARPDVQALAGLISDVTVGTGQFFSNLSIGAQGGAQAIHDLGSELKDLEGELGTTLGAVAKLYGYIDTANTAVNKAGQGTGFWSQTLGDLNGLLHDTLDPVTQVKNAATGLSDIFGQGGKAVENTGGIFQTLGRTVDSAAKTAAESIPMFAGLSGAIETLGMKAEAAYATGISDLIGGVLSLDQAQLGAKQSIMDTTKALKDHHSTLRSDSAAGLAHQRVLLDDAQSAKTVYDATLKQTHSVDKATSAYNGYWDALEKNLRAHHELTPAIQALIDKYKNLPPKKETKINAPGLAAAEADAGEYAHNLREIPRSVHTTVTTTYYTKGRPHTGPLSQNASRWGNIYEPAADGLLTQAQYYPPVNPGRFMIAEPATQGEAFIPKRGDYGRSMNILAAAAGWYGARVIEGGGRSSGGGGGPVVVNIMASDPQGKAILSAMRFAIQGAGGEVVKSLKPR